MTPPLRIPLRVAAEHPALDGHFPGEPLVPGVLVLDRIAEALAAAHGLHVTALETVKFRAPLLPGETATVTCTRDGERLAFHVECTRRGMTIRLAEGRLCVSGPSPEPGA